jgi:tripartite-type tricarboxylate transporter receptor subunit TctC
LLLLIVRLLPGLAARAEFPNRPLRMVAGLAAGGTADIVARLVAKGMGSHLGQQIMVESRGGTGGRRTATRCCSTARFPCCAMATIRGRR